MEVVVALAIFSFASLSLGQLLCVAQRWRVAAQRQAHAVELAAKTMERLRAGDRPEPLTDGLFRCHWATEPLAAYPDLSQVDVTVAWSTPAEQRVTLSTLMRMPP